MEKYNYRYKNGDLKLKIFIEKCFNKNINKETFQGVFLSNMQKKDVEEYILPNGVWAGYLENGNLEFEVDFNILKPKGFWSEERAKSIDFDYSVCEIRKYDNNQKSINK